MSALRAIDIDLLDHLFDMGGGYVLDFNDRTFGDFFRRELQVNIDEPRWTLNGTSKAKRLRYLLQTVDDATARRVLAGLWEYRETKRKRAGQDETVPNAEQEFWDLAVRLGGKKPPEVKPPPATTNPGPDKELLAKLGAELVEVSKLPAQRKGYAFEAFLKSFFDAYGLDPRKSFRVVGEQIDGSFQLHGETYLFEARWRAAQAAIGDLNAFHGKLDKAAWTRGLFVSMSGFTDEGLAAFGKGKRLVCMDALDLYETLNNGRRLDEVIARKVRRAAETGEPFVRVRDLF